MEEMQRTVVVGPSASSTPPATSFGNGGSIPSSSSSFVTHKTCSVFCLQRWPGENLSSHRKHGPFSLFSCISRSVSLLNGVWRRVRAGDVSFDGGVGVRESQRDW